ncbi:MAG: ribonuclease PH [Alphaproteobacteria bacterium]|nr:ribonuclease PH [Alphaproteobacteria bacterium]
MRANNRKHDATRTISIITGVNKYAEGSCLISFGDTKVLCTATIENKVPPFLRNSGSGWITAEYSMLPRATQTRTDRDHTKIHPNGRTVEISRLIGRSLRSVVNLKAMGERQIFIDCDVLQADGGTRTAAITGGYVAMAIAFKKFREMHSPKVEPLLGSISAVSCGIVDGQPRLDLDFEEDFAAHTDANFVMSGDGRIVEIQATAEKNPFTKAELDSMLDLAIKGAAEIQKHQQEAIGE